MAPPILYDKDTLYNLFIKENLAVKKVADKLNSSRGIIKRHLEYYDIFKSREMVKECMRVSNKKTYDSHPEIKELIAAKTSYAWYHGSKEKHEKTMIERYGVPHTVQSKELRAKYEKTMIERYGVANSVELPQVRKINIEQHLTGEFQRKMIKTKKKNNSFHISKPEEDAYKVLVGEFGKEDVLRQYVSDKYPFPCDFYIKSLDLYIEINFSWTHHGKLYRAFDKDDLECQKVYEKFKSKTDTSRFYQRAIDTWTVRDPHKREVARQNNLNWIEFFKEEDFQLWVENKQW